MMQKFLIILKFSQPSDFCGFFEHFITGQVVLPSSDPLSVDSKVVLKLLIPLIEKSFVVGGTVVSAIGEIPKDAGMRVALDKNFKTIVSDIRAFFSGIEFYGHLLDLEIPDPEIFDFPDEFKTDESKTDDSGTDEFDQKDQSDTRNFEIESAPEFEIEMEKPEPVIEESPVISQTKGGTGEKEEELAGIEMHISEEEIQLLEDSSLAAESDQENREAVATASHEPDFDEDLMNLRMENEDFHVAPKVDISHVPDFQLMDEDAEEAFQKKQDPASDSRGTCRDDSAGPYESFDLADDVPAAEGFVMDMDPVNAESGGLSFDDRNGVAFEELRLMVDQDEYEFDLKPEPEISTRKIPEKKDLTPEERAKAEPVGQFFMNLTKAMLRSGYYAPGHPGADSAKAGLYEEFMSVLRDQREIMIANHSTREGVDLMLTGILDEPVSIRVLVGVGVAELFAPKLSDYCERKQLLSFALKKEIPPDHFYQFIDIMSDPKVDDHQGDEAGRFLTAAFIERGITNISTVFVDDMVKLETDLPWRVEMAIHRLAKDLKVMPLFKNVDSDAIKKMKLQTVQDIIRPLKHPTYLNDFLVNCYIIAKYVTDMPAEEIEEIVVDAFSIKLLIPTSQFTFKELESLKKLKLKHPESEVIDRRLMGIKRILKLISRRVVKEEESGAQNFLQYLYRNNILSFNELPADVQFIINTMKMADDVRDNFLKYFDGIKNVTAPLDALVYLKCFRRTVPVLIDWEEWETISKITSVVRQMSARAPMNTEKVHSGLKIKRSGGDEDLADASMMMSLEIADRPMAFIFKDITDKLIAAYEHADPDTRNTIDKIIDGFGAFGVDIISRMLSDSNNRDVRKKSFDMMKSKGMRAREWAMDALSDVKRPWYLHRNAMMIIAHVSDSEEDFPVVRNFLAHSNPKLREEALNIAVALKPHDAETILLNAIHDSDPKVRWRAMRSLPDFSPISESSMNELLSIVARPVPKETADGEKHIHQVVQIISAINAMTYIPMSRKVEAEILAVLQPITEGKKSLWHRIKKGVASQDELPILKAAIPLLGRIGGSRSGNELKKIGRFHPDLASLSDKAVAQIKTRNMEEKK